MTSTVTHKFEAFEKVYAEDHDWDSTHSLWSIDTTSNSPESATYIEDGDNPYDMIDKFVDLGLEGQAMIVMYGWAAPFKDTETEPSVAPSRHPERQRVRLYVYMDNGTVSTAMQMKGQGIDAELGDGEGALKEAIEEAINRKKNNK